MQTLAHCTIAVTSSQLDETANRVHAFDESSVAHQVFAIQLRKGSPTMLSRSALAIARALCGFERENFLKVGRRCISYLRIRHAVLGPFETQADKDEAFVMLFRCELDHPHEDEILRRSHASWISA